MIKPYSPTVAIRLDVSQQIGMGHFIRCLALANELQSGGAVIRFVCRALPKHLQELLIASGHSCRLLHSIDERGYRNVSPYSSWLGVCQEIDAVATCSALSDGRWDWLIVDHYAIDESWESYVKGYVGKLMVIDDIANRNHVCDVLLDQNPYPNKAVRYDNKVNKSSTLLLGSEYALLRPAFRALRHQTATRKVPVKKILVFLGGMDEKDGTSRVINLLQKIKLTQWQIDVVVGQRHPNIDAIISRCRASNMICHVETDNMAGLMASADLSIGAGGSANWERCCLGLPSILMAMAENQIEIGTALDFEGASIFLGLIEEVTDEHIKDHLLSVASSTEKLEMLSQNCYRLVDGLGCQRVSNHLMNL